MQPGIFSF